MQDPNESPTELLRAVSKGDQSAYAKVWPIIQSELHALAASFMARERVDHTLQPTALVNEAYLKLIDQKRVDWKDHNHFRAVAATVMRRLLVDHARAHRARMPVGGRPPGEPPNTGAMGPGDVRITTRYDEAAFGTAFFSAIETALFSLDDADLARAGSHAQRLMRDPARVLITVLFGNLLTNAVKFTPRDGRVDIRVELGLVGAVGRRQFLGGLGLCVPGPALVF